MAVSLCTLVITCDGGRLDDVEGREATEEAGSEGSGGSREDWRWEGGAEQQVPTVPTFGSKAHNMQQLSGGKP